MRKTQATGFGSLTQVEAKLETSIVDIRPLAPWRIDKANLVLLTGTSTGMRL